MRSCTRRAGVIVAFVVAGLFGAPSATADPSVPGDPTGQIYTPPGYIGYYPGVYGLQSIWSLTPPPRVRDAGGTRAMTNADPESAHVGMPGDRLGVQLKHVTVKPHEAGPLGQVFGARPSSPMQQTAVPEAAGGTAPGRRPLPAGRTFPPDSPWVWRIRLLLGIRAVGRCRAWRPGNRPAARRPHRTPRTELHHKRRTRTQVAGRIPTPECALGEEA
ncbi:Uncharacterised protein [Mycobacteroides abscessus]|nr:Uncharacterised protein [Mycobacteroides abscessus]